VFFNNPENYIQWKCGDYGPHYRWVPKAFNKVIVTKDLEGRRIGWIAAMCDRYLTDHTRYSGAFGWSSNDCRHEVDVDTASGRVHAPKHHHHTWGNWIDMGRDSWGHYSWHCMGSRRRGIYAGHYGQHCGRYMNQVRVGWQSRRRDWAVMWECRYQFGTLRKMDPQCQGLDRKDYPGHDLTDSAGKTKAGKTDTWMECATKCGNDADCFSWSWVKYNDMCYPKSRPRSKMTLYYNYWVVSGDPSLHCDGTLYSFSAPSHWYWVVIHLGRDYWNKLVTISTVGLMEGEGDTKIGMPCVNDDFNADTKESECTAQTVDEQQVRILVKSGSLTGQVMVKQVVR